MAEKVSNKSVYDLQKKELKNRTEVKFDTGLKVMVSNCLGSLRPCSCRILHLQQ
jgi:hypothetical protein